MMKTYDIEAVVEHRYRLQMSGENRVDAVNKALAHVVTHENELETIDIDYGIESIKESK